jgi:glycosyltransferase involved in cell wall biosynthesis
MTSRRDVLVVSLGATAGLRDADDELAASLRRAGATVAVVETKRAPTVRTFALTDLLWARAARRAAVGAPAARSVVYSSVTAALLWPRPGAIRFDAPAAGNRPGRHGFWQRPVERRRLVAASLLAPWSALALAEVPQPHAPAIVVPVPVEPSGRAASRDVAAITYAADPAKKGLDRVLAAWGSARKEGEELIVVGVSREEAPSHVGSIATRTQGVRYVAQLPRAEYRALLRRARVFVTAPRREDHGIAQLEALADGAQLLTTPAPGPYVALPLARALDPRLATTDLAGGFRAALDDPVSGYAERAIEAIAPFRRDAVDTIVAERLLPALLM